MRFKHLQTLFHPQSVAVIGASQRAHSIGKIVLDNLIGAGFKGPIYPVNPKYKELASIEVYASIGDLPQAPELAVLCTPAATIPGLIAELGALGTRAAIVIGAGLSGVRDRHGKSLSDQMLAAAKPYGLRILGPNCVGLLVPEIGLNASFAHINATPGKLAFVSQSGALVTGVLDWATARGIGFSKFISVGDGADIDFGDLLDYLASDADTHAILLYVEGIRNARKFMSAARAAARSKPVLIVKAGRAPESALAAASHTGALAGSDAVYDAAIRRAGMLRVFSTDDLFNAVETLARARPLAGDALTIMTNGGGPGVMATDALMAAGGTLARLAPASLHALDAVLPLTWSRGNPVDIIGDAPAERYRQTLEILLQDPQAGSILFIHAPTAIVPSTEIAAQVAQVVEASSRNVLACWLGGEAVAPARELFSRAGIATYDTPEKAVHGFMQTVQYRRNQALLMEVPHSLATDFHPDRERARAIIAQVLADGRDMLSEPESKQLLAAYGIPVVQTAIAQTVEEAVAAAGRIGFPVAVKVLSPDISHKSDVGGVALDLTSPEEVRSAAGAMLIRLQKLKPDARLQGFSVQTMARRPEAQEIIIGVSTDPTFGPVILFGQGGIAVEVMDDHALSLPPLNTVLARDLISRTRIARLLAGYRNRPPADMEAICRSLIQVSQMVADLPELRELDINPLLADSNGVIAVDARVRVQACAVPADGVERFAIRPYPEEWEDSILWQGHPLLLRPIRPEDGQTHLDFFNALDPEDVRYRMFVRVRELQPSQLARLTQIDYDREMAFIATRKSASGEWETLGVARAVADPDNLSAEFAVIVRSDLKGQGLGVILMNKLIAYCKARGMHSLSGEALSHNAGVLGLARHLGFAIAHTDDPGTLAMRLDLTVNT